jgi:DNA-binding transcriptional LysR family regulator
LHKHVQSSDTSSLASMRRLAWDDFKLILAVQASRSFKGAARSLGRSTNTVRNHLARLEDIAGAPLVLRSPQGVTLTAAGLQLFDIAKEMAASSMRMASEDEIESLHSRRVSLHVSEGIGTFWLVPRLVEFQLRHPDIIIELNCTQTPPATFNQANDISVQLVRPTDPDSVSSHLATLHMIPFGSPEYVRKHGAPSDLQQAQNHKIVLQTGDKIRDGVFNAIFGDVPPTNLIAMETNSSAAHYWAIAQGLGIGILPTYARAITKNVFPLDIDLKLRRDLWLSHPISAKKSKAVRTVIKWLHESFNPTIYPWFSKEFIHPNQFENQFEGTNVVRLFSGFMEIAELKK